MLQELVKPEEIVNNNKIFKTEGNPDFDWETHEADCPSLLRKGNPHVKTRNGDKVFSRAKDAQKMYDMYLGSFENMVPNIELGDRLTGKIWGVDSRWATIDAGYRELIYIDLEKEAPSFRKLIEKDRELSVKVTATSRERGFFVGSVTEGTKQVVFNELLESSKEENMAYVGKVEEMIPGGGYMVTVQGVECFMPGSLAGINKLVDFESIIGQEMYVVPVSFSPEKGTIVVSHRKYLQAMIPQHIDTLRGEMEKEHDGHVTGSTKYGVFVEFNGCLTGMIHINDLSLEFSELYSKNQLTPGTPITFFVKDIITDTKITLTQKIDSKVNPWNGAAAKYPAATEVTGIVRSIKDYGIFVEIEEGITGLLHSSELNGINLQDIKKGDPIRVTINRIEEETRKVFLKLL